MVQKIKQYLLLYVLLIIFSLQGVCSKMAGMAKLFSPKFLFWYGLLFLILAIYAIGQQQVIKKMPLSTAYANKAVTIIFGSLQGFLFFKEIISIKQIAGMIVIIIGVITYAFSE